MRFKVRTFHISLNIKEARTGGACFSVVGEGAGPVAMGAVVVGPGLALDLAPDWAPDHPAQNPSKNGNTFRVGCQHVPLDVNDSETYR